MKKVYFVLVAGFLLFFTSCDEQNYEIISEMNNIHSIEIVYYTAESDSELGEFPVSRNVYSDLLEEIEKDKPAYIILKFFFDSEKDQDLELSNTIVKYNNILTQATTGLDPMKISPDSVLEKLSLDNISFKSVDHEQIVLPNDTLLSSFAGIGMVDFISSNKNEYLNFQLISQVRGYYLPSLALKMGMMITGSEPVYKKDSIDLGGKELLITNGMFRIDLSEPHLLYKTYSFVEVLNRNKGDIDFSNKIIIVFIEDPAVRNVKSKYGKLHNAAEIVADSINTVLKKLEWNIYQHLILRIDSTLKVDF